MDSIKRRVPWPVRHSLRGVFNRMVLPWSTYRYERNKQQEWDQQAIAWVQAGDYSELPEWEIIWRDLQSYVLPIATENNIREAIDIGCGTGWLVRRLARAMDHVYGYDIMPTIIAYLKGNAIGGQNVSYDCVDLAVNSPILPKCRYLLTSGYVLSHNSVRSVKRILEWVDSISEPRSVCFFSEAWKMGRTTHLGPSDYIHGVDDVWGRFLRNWDLSFLGDVSSPFEADRAYFREHPRQIGPGDRVGKGLVGVKVR